MGTKLQIAAQWRVKYDQVNLQTACVVTIEEARARLHLRQALHRADVTMRLVHVAVSNSYFRCHLLSSGT